MSTPDNDSDYILQAKTKAVVFTHINLRPEDIARNGQLACIEEYTPLFQRYLKCRNVGLVYMYLSLGAEKIVRAIIEGKPLAVQPEDLKAESECLAILQLAETQARQTRAGRPLKFVHVTSTQLLALFKNLHDIDPRLFSFFHSHGAFTLDSPRFVEVIIRVARGQDPRSAYQPIVRFDEDVEINEISLDKLLAAYENFLKENVNLCFFFSGCYGDPGEPDRLDPINDRTVRTHWLSDYDQIADVYVPNEPKIKLFWRDLGEVGATQLGVNGVPSLRGQTLIAERGFSANRRSLQLYSGSGQIISLRCAQDLPPFMNMGQLTVWMDDHLPRQLFERIGYISPYDIESVTEARFKQNRHPAGISQKDVNWAGRDGSYFDRLLAGCMMDALISQPAREGNRVIRKPTEFAQVIKTIIANPAAQIDHNAMRPKLNEYAERRYEQTLWLWQTPEFEGTVLYQWACEKAKDARHKDKLAADIVEDACAYLELVKLWRGSFAAAIGRLMPIGNLWLFERVQ